MSSDGWVSRALNATRMPADLAASDMVEYQLMGDDRTYGPSEVRSLGWGRGVGPDGEGWIAAYRRVAVVPARKHGHYFKPVAGLQHVDVYRTLELFGVTDPCLQHAIKKLLVAGGRGAGKDIRQDVKEAIDSLQRWQEMRAEDERRTRSA